MKVQPQRNALQNSTRQEANNLAQQIKALKTDVLSAILGTHTVGEKLSLNFTCIK